MSGTRFAFRTIIWMAILLKRVVWNSHGKAFPESKSTCEVEDLTTILFAKHLFWCTLFITYRRCVPSTELQVWAVDDILQDLLLIRITAEELKL